MRDDAASERDRRAALRDLQAGVRDRLAGREAAGVEQPGLHGDNRRESARDRMDSMFDRQANGRDRAAAAEEAAARVAELEQALRAALAHVTELEQAVQSRDLIGQATGILMQRYGVGPEEAFAELVRRSQALNVKLGQIAERVASQQEP